MKIYKFIIWFAYSVLFFGCESTNTPNYSSQSARFMPLNVGNYWVYEYYEVDINQQKVSNTFLDSIYIDSKTTIEGKNAYILKTFRNNGFIGNSYIYSENDALYRLYDFSIDTLPKGFQKNSWQKFAGFNLNPEGLWHVFDTSFNNYSTQWLGELFSGRKNINLNGKYLNEYNLNIFGKERVILNFSLIYDQISDLVNGDSVKKRLIYTNKRTENIKFAENIGINEWNLQPSSFNTILNGQISGVHFTNGWSRKLLRYKLKD